MAGEFWFGVVVIGATVVAATFLGNVLAYNRRRDQLPPNWRRETYRQHEDR